MKNILLISTLILMYASASYTQEVCDNGIDDDGDQLIDLNDDDCNCPTSLPSSLIPNPSFEDRTCCPMNENELECAVSWQQASVATSDYFHTCGLTYHQYLGYRAPQPLPDGDGYVGFRDGKSSAHNFKEYVGACLNDVMEVGVMYRLDFFIGFPVNPNNFDQIDITLFGTTACNNIPFGQGNQNFGCPTNGSGWIEIDHQLVTGTNEWKNIVLEFTCTQPYEAIVIGPNCAIHPDVNRAPYFFIDRLTIAKSVDFEIPFAAIEGDPCGKELTLIGTNDPSYKYQWYKDGIALPGAIDTDITLQIQQENEGVYQALISTEEGCFKSEKYILRTPVFEEILIAQICEGDTFYIQDNPLTDSGIFTFEYISSLGCDSTLQLYLEVLEVAYSHHLDSICIGEFLVYEGFNYNEAGQFDIVLNGANGCDSIVTLTISYQEPQGLVTIPNIFNIILGDPISISPNFIDPSYVDFTWTNAGGDMLSNEVELKNYLPLKSEIITFEAKDDDGCSKIENIQLSVDRKVDIYVPNVFSPNADNINDRFVIKAGQSIARLKQLLIFDRWGNLVFKEQHEGSIDNMEGWDGTANGRLCAPGIYVFKAELIAYDGLIEKVTGDLLLMQ